MSLKQFAYIGLVIIVAVASVSVGAFSSALVLYKLGEDRLAEITAASPATEAGVLQDAGPSTALSGTLLIKNTNVETTVTEVVKQAGPAVVTVVGKIPGQRTPFGSTGGGEVSGSGVFISEDGYILTNNHVVDGALELSIILADGTQQAATLVGTDIYADLAVLKTDGPVPAVATFGNSDALEAGETVIAIGSPLGEFMNSVTVGVVSATGRSIDTGEGYQIEGLIQTDAAINQGNSGGPLVNLAGEVVGINTLVVRGSGTGAVAEGLGFSIPSNTIQAVAGQIIATGKFSRPYLGVQFQVITPQIARMYRLPAEYGVYITRVASGSPAADAGLQPGDIITQVGAVELDETHSYINTLFKYQPGDSLAITLLRDDREQQVQVTLGES